VEIFADTANLDEIKELNSYGLLDGVTTNPTLIAKAGKDFKQTIHEICQVVSGPVSAEVASTQLEGMIAEGEVLAAIAKNVTVKLPITLEGLRACRHFAGRGIPTNLTLCFSANQALLAAKAGATYVSPFLGRLDDININGMDLIADIRKIFDNYAMQTKILSASIRSANHVKEAALLGSDSATMPPSVIRSLVQHPLTEKGLAQFIEDWKKTGQVIL
jgi:transaldolase